MTFQSVGNGFLVPMVNSPVLSPTFAFSTAVVDAVGEGMGYVFETNVTDTITKVGFHVNTVTTSGDIEVRLETVDANFLPSGTLAGTDTNGVVSVTAAGGYEVTLTSALSVTPGQRYAVVAVRPGTGAVVCSFSLMQSSQSTRMSGVPTSTIKTTASWAIGTNISNIWVVYGTNGYSNKLFTSGITAFTSVNYSTSTTPDVIGNVIRFPYDVQINALYAIVDFDGACDIKLLDSDGSTVLRSVSNPANYPNNTGVSQNIHAVAPITLTANTDYRVIVEPTTTTNSAIVDFVFFNADLRAQYPMGEFAWKTSAKDPVNAASYTDNTGRFVAVGVNVVAIDIPTSGGGGLAANVIRGFIG